MTRSFLITIAFLLLGSYSVQAQCTASISQTTAYTCVGSPFLFNAASGGTGYQWLVNGNPVGTGTDTLMYTPVSAGTFSVTVVIDFSGCIDTSNASTLNVGSLPIPNAFSNSACIGGTLQLYGTVMGTGPFTYMWNGPNGFASNFMNPIIPNATPLHNGNYLMLVTNGMGCMAIDTVVVDVQPGFAVNASSSGPGCIGDTIYLYADSILGATYYWTGPGGFTSTQQDPMIIVDNNTEGGDYFVLVDDGSCYVNDTTIVTVCNTIAVNLYSDMNNNCIFDTGDSPPFMPSIIEIDSSGIPVDTISVTAGFYYTANGNIGDTVSFKVLSLPSGYQSSCPVSGIVDHVLQTSSFTNIDIGFNCGTSNAVDLAIYASNPISTATWQAGYIYLTNAYCLPENATVTLQHSPKYTYNISIPAPASTSGNTITWNVSNLAATNILPTSIWYHLTYSTSPLLANDTVNSTFTVTATNTDIDLTNNIWIKHDTVVASFDPNAIMAYPETCIEAGDQLQYTIMFENIGNAPAENIYVLDTLPAELDANTMELVMSSHNMFVHKTEVNGQTIFKFDFPNINLPDSSDHIGCHGQLIYNIKTNNTLPYGANIDHRAGIYFDYNSVVMTNTYRSSICVPNDVVTISGSNNIKLYPNPANNELTVQADKSFDKCTITNSIGQQMLQEDLNGTTKLNIRSLSPGIYYIKLHGPEAQQTLKFVKM